MQAGCQAKMRSEAPFPTGGQLDWAGLRVALKFRRLDFLFLLRVVLRGIFTTCALVREFQPKSFKMFERVFSKPRLETCNYQ